MGDEELKREVDDYVDEVWEDVVADIRSLVRIRSVEDLSHAAPGMPWGPKSHEALALGLSIASRLGLDAHDCEGYLGYADLVGESAGQIATIAHTDVVPEGLGWTVDPFDVTRREGFLMGRGVLDDKGPFVLSLYAAHFFARRVQRTGERLPYTLRVLVGNDEETTMGDVTWYLSHYEQPLFCFSPDADFPLICGEKGVFHGRFRREHGTDGRIVSLEGGTVVNAIPGLATATVRTDASTLPASEGIDVEAMDGGLAKLTAHGKGGHASLPEGTVNAIGMLATYLLQNGICDEGEREFLELERLVCASGHDGDALGIACSNERFGALTAIGGTVSDSDGFLEQTIDCRYPDATTGEGIAARLSSVAADHGASFEVIQDKVPFYEDPASPEISTLLSTYEEYSGRKTEPLVIGGGTYARKFRNACAFGPHEPAEDVPSWVGMEHGPDEAVSEESLRRALKIYIVSIARLMRLDLA